MSYRPSGWRLRLIDPVPKPTQAKGIMALPYNPAAFIDFRADFASVILLIREILDGRRPFDRLRGVNGDLPYLRRAIGDEHEHLNSNPNPDSLLALTKSIIGDKMDLTFLRAYGRQVYQREFAALAAALEWKHFPLKVPRSSLTLHASLQSQKASSADLEAQFPPPPPKEVLGVPVAPTSPPPRSAMKKSDGSGGRKRATISDAPVEEIESVVVQKK